MFTRRLAVVAGAVLALTTTALPSLFGAATAAPPYPIPGPQPQPRIVGGHPAPGPGPAVAIYTTERHYLCGGTLIAEDTVLTAAHCASKLPTTEAEVSDPPVTTEGLIIRAGSLNRTEGGAVRKVTQVGLEPGWAWNRESGPDDLAVLHLDAPVRDVAPAEVGSPDPGQPVDLAGWGVQVPPAPPLAVLPSPLAEQLPALPTRPEPPTMLHRVDLWVVDSSDCQSAQPGIGPGETCLAARALVTDTCIGDSGSGGLQNGRVVAVVSRGTPAALSCGLSRTVATDPGHYLAWITKTIAEQRNAA